MLQDLYLEAYSRKTRLGDGGKSLSLLFGYMEAKLIDGYSFYVNLPIGAISFAIILVYFHTPPQAKPATASLREKVLNIDTVGTMLVISALICILLDMQWGGTTKSWSSSDVIGTLVGFVLLTLLFTLNEIWQGERALMVPRILKQRIVATCCLYVFL